MNNLAPSQLKGLSEFLNSVAATWFSAGVISPLFVETESFAKIIFLSGIEISMALSLLFVSILLLRKVKL